MNDHLEPKPNDIKMLVLADTHISTRKIEPGMGNYVYGNIGDGCENQTGDYAYCSLIDLQKTWDKLVLAARVIAAIDDPSTIYCVGQRLFAQRAIIKFAQQIGAKAAPGRFTPGQFTNQVTKCFVEPRLLLVADPRTDSQAVKEASYVNIPTIAFCGADSSLKYIDVAIPGNNRNKESIGLLYWMLAREVKRIRGDIPRNMEYDVKVDLFFYKDPEEIEKIQEAEAAAAENFEEAADEYGYEAYEYDEYDNFGAEATAGQEATGTAAAVGVDGFNQQGWEDGPAPMGGPQDGSWDVQDGYQAVGDAAQPAVAVDAQYEAQPAAAAPAQGQQWEAQGQQWEQPAAAPQQAFYAADQPQLDDWDQ